MFTVLLNSFTSEKIFKSTYCSRLSLLIFHKSKMYLCISMNKILLYKTIVLPIKCREVLSQMMYILQLSDFSVCIRGVSVIVDVLF